MRSPVQPGYLASEEDPVSVKKIVSSPPCHQLEEIDSMVLGPNDERYDHQMCLNLEKSTMPASKDSR